MIAIGGDNVPADAAAFDYGSPRRIAYFQSAVKIGGTNHGENFSRAQLQRCIYSRTSVLCAKNHFLESYLGSGLEADGRPCAPKKEVGRCGLSGADEGTLFENMAAFQIAECDAVHGTIALA